MLVIMFGNLSEMYLKGSNKIKNDFIELLPLIKQLSQKVNAIYKENDAFLNKAMHLLPNINVEEWRNDKNIMNMLNEYFKTQNKFSKKLVSLAEFMRVLDRIIKENDQKKKKI